MKLGLQKKGKVISKICKVLEISLSVVVASLEGIHADELTVLRSLCRKRDVYVYVIRNTLLRRAFKGTAFECLCPLFIGSNIIGFSTVEAGDCARLFVEFSKEFYENFKIKGAVFDSVFIEGSKINFLADLPTYKDCVMRLILIIRESALGKLVRLLHILCSDRENKK